MSMYKAPSSMYDFDATLPRKATYIDNEQDLIFTYKRGLISIAFSNQMKVDDYSDDYLSVEIRSQHDSMSRPIMRQYISVNKHKALLKIAATDINNIIKSAVEDGVERGVIRASAEDKRTLKSIQSEREELEKKLQKLEKLEAKELAKIEARQELDSLDPSGYVYLLSAMHDKTLYKIGRTINPKNRLKTFGVKLPFDVEYECVIQTDDMYDLEMQLHRHFAKVRLQGEWFKLSPEDVQYIKSLGATP